MRRFLVVSTLLLGGAAAAQEQPQPQPPPAPAPAMTSPLKLMAIMLDTQQVMLWNESAGEYQLARVGDEIESWRLVSVQPEARRVVVLQRGTRDELYLNPLPKPNAPADPRLPRMAPVITLDNCPSAPIPGLVSDEPAGPQAQPPAAAEVQQPMDPYATPAPAPPPVRQRPARPMNPYAAQVPLPAPQPLAAPPVAAPPTPQDPYAAPPAVAPVPAPAAAAPVESHTLTRVELNRELRDFDRLLSGITVAPAAGGGFTLTRVEPKTWVAKIGLRSGDVVRSVAGETVTSIEDAARVYARLGSLDNFLVVVERGQQKLVLSYSVKQ
jgi:hypothetical protein